MHIVVNTNRYKYNNGIHQILYMCRHSLVYFWHCRETALSTVCGQFACMLYQKSETVLQCTKQVPFVWLGRPQYHSGHTRYSIRDQKSNSTFLVWYINIIMNQIAQSKQKLLLGTSNWISSQLMRGAAGNSFVQDEVFLWTWILDKDLLRIAGGGGHCGGSGRWGADDFRSSVSL